MEDPKSRVDEKGQSVSLLQSPQGAAPRIAPSLDYLLSGLPFLPQMTTAATNLHWKVEEEGMIYPVEMILSRNTIMKDFVPLLHGLCPKNHFHFNFQSPLLSHMVDFSQPIETFTKIFKPAKIGPS